MTDADVTKPAGQASNVGRIYQLNVSPGGVPKHPITHGTIGPLGLEGDGHRDPGHGGPDRAICLFSLEVIERLQAEGHPIFPGATGENVTLHRLDYAQIYPGARLELGDDVVLEVTRTTTPCTNIAFAFTGGAYERIAAKLHPGESRLYARVLVGGTVRQGDAVRMTSPALA